MIDQSFDEQIMVVHTYEDLVSTPFRGKMNAICWTRKLAGDFAEIVDQVPLNENMKVVEAEELLSLNLSKQGQLAREVILTDLRLLQAHGAAPILNLIESYERDDVYPFFPTDVYSFHVDQSPIPADTFLCTYYGQSSEILPNAQAQQKVLIPELRDELKKYYHGTDEGFEHFLNEHCFDLHFEAKPNASPIRLGIGELWKLAIEHPERQSLPCIHRAPKERPGQKRLMLIC